MTHFLHESMLSHNVIPFLYSIQLISHFLKLKKVDSYATSVMNWTFWLLEGVKAQ